MLIAAETQYFDLDIERVMRDERIDPTMKWLFVCLVGICKRDGYSHRSARDLSREVSISNGKISESVPKLRDLGYIEAKLAPNESGHETWHITIPAASCGIILREPTASEQEANLTAQPQTATLLLGDRKVTISIESI